MIWTQARQAFEHGELLRAHTEADGGYQRFRTSNAAWAWKFRVLDAEALLWQGRFQDTASMLSASDRPALDRELTIESLSLLGAALARLHSFDSAEAALRKADQLCVEESNAGCGGVLRSRGVLATQRGQMNEARSYFMQSLAFSRAHGDRFLEANALLNLGLASLSESRFDEAIDWLNAAKSVASQMNAGEIVQTAQGNLGWAYRGLGDADKALDLTRQAEASAASLNDHIRQASWTTNKGYVYMDESEFPLAAAALMGSLELARSDGNASGIFNALRALAFESERAGHFRLAAEYADQALTIAQAEHNQQNALYPTLVKASVARHADDRATAEALYRKVESDTASNAALRWQAQFGLAQLMQDEGVASEADAEYRKAMATVEGARAEVRLEESRLPFLTNAFSIYDSYISFLIKRGETAAALRWADYNRARMLTEGNGVGSGIRLAGPEVSDPQRVAKLTGAIILFYWLGEKQSYLWAIAPTETRLYTLPPESEIDEAVDDYNRALAGPQDVIAAAIDSGPLLYRLLIAPADDVLANSKKVFVIPNGGLNRLSFESLIVPSPKPHFWLEDVTVANATSLRLLAGMRSVKKGAKDSLLLLGDPVSPNKDYPELPQASVEMAQISKQFKAERSRSFAREAATPVAYLSSQPEKYAFIHFAAHGTASRLSPLDSAIVLSKASAADDSFKLYARDIMRHPLRAELVTISTCSGAGTRTFPSEGMVGLSWAFLRAGAHNVVGALWEVSDDATAEMMDVFYGELSKGTPPNAALRAAKLKLLHGGGSFSRPYYWAPFQLYAGS